MTIERMRIVRHLARRAATVAGVVGAVVASAGILAGAVAVGMFLTDLRAGSPSGAGGPSRTATPAPSGTSHAVIPWAPAREAPWPTPTPHTPLPMRICSADDLNPTVSVGVAMGTTYLSFMLANRSATPCQLLGVPPVLAFSPTGEPIETRSSDAGDDRAPPVLLEPGHASFSDPRRGGDAIVRVGWAAWCGRDVAIATFVIGLPSGESFKILAPGTSEGRPLRLPSRCDLGTSLEATPRVFVGPFEPSKYPEQPTPTPPPLLLTATIEAPDTIVIGTMLRYTATLTNATASAYRFGECPVFVHSLVKNWGRYRLNCDSVSSLAPGARATFEMLLAIDPERSVAGDTGQLRWYLEPFPNSADATARVALVRDPRPTPTPAAKPTR